MFPERMGIHGIILWKMETLMLTLQYAHIF